MKKITVFAILLGMVLSACASPTPPPSFVINSQTAPSCYTTDSGDWGKISVENNRVHLAVNPPDVVYDPCSEKVFSDFTFEADATMVDSGVKYETTGFGLMFRVDYEKYRAYVFQVTAKGSATLFYYDGGNGDFVDLFTDIPIPEIKAGDTVHLKVVAKGDQISVYLNDALVKSVQDSALTSGGVGFVIMSDETNAQEVFFENAKVFEP